MPPDASEPGPRPIPAPEPPSITPEELLAQVARGDEEAFDALYITLAARVFGLIRRVLRDPSQAEEVAQEVFVELWRTAPRFDPAQGSATTWALTMAHRRAVDRVRSEQAASERQRRVQARDVETPFDHVVEEVTSNLEREQVRRCLGSLTELQNEAVTLAYYGGLTYREVAALLSVNLATVKTRMRDGLIRLRDCLGVGRRGRP